MNKTRNGCEVAPEYSDGAYAVTGQSGIAFWVMGWEVEPDENAEWTGIEERTGRLIVRMVGDDRNFAVDTDDVTPLEEETFCTGCGQIGCRH